MSWQTKGFYTCCGLLVIVLCIFPCAGKKAPNLEPVTQDEVDALRQKIGEEQLELNTDYERIHDALDTEEAKQAAMTEHEDAPMDYDAMLQAMIKTASDQVSDAGKQEKIRQILEKRMNDFGGKAKSFMLSKLNITASDLMEAVDKEEELLLLEWNEAVEANFPPAAVVIAGLLSPLMLALYTLNHWNQGMFLFLPVTIMCICSLYIDHDVPCPGIPGLQVWIYVNLGLAGILFLSHMVQLVKVATGMSTLAEKASRIKGKLDEIDGQEQTSLGDMREKFVGRAVLVQQALLIEDTVRTGIAHTLVGFLTLVWMLVMIWTFVIAIGYTFVPGVAAFHAAAQATAGEAFCGTWMSVLTARLNAILGLLFLLVNLLTVAQWGLDVFTHSAQFEKKVLKAAKRFDDGAGGVPLCQLLVKAFVLRGSTDTVYAKMNVCTNEKIHLSRKEQELDSKVKGLQSDLAAKTGNFEALQNKARGLNNEVGFGGIIKQLEDSREDTEGWKEKGKEAIVAAEQRVLPPADADTSKLDELVQRVTDTVDAIRNSPEFEAAKQQAIEAAEEAQRLAEQAAVKAQELAAQAAVKAKELADEAQKKAQEIVDSEEFKEGVKAMKEGAQDLADKGMEKGRELAEQGQEVAQQGLEKGKEIAEQAKVKGTEVAEQVKQKASEVDVEAIKAQAAETVEQGKEKAAEAVEKGKEKATGKKSTKKK